MVDFSHCTWAWYHWYKQHFGKIIDHGEHAEAVGSVRQEEEEKENLQYSTAWTGF